MAGPEGQYQSPWSPLKIEVFRAVWLAGLFSNIGDWMQTVGAQWLLVNEPRAATLVALVQTADTIPFVFLAFPAGVLADMLDRRRLLVGIQAFQVVAGIGLVAFTFAGEMPPALLLMFTFLIGSAAAMASPTLQSMIPSLVSRGLIPSASTLGSVSANVGRAAGPALAGVLVARLGAGAVFAVNVLSFVTLGLVVLIWGPRARHAVSASERFVPALRAGGRYLRFAPVVRRILMRVGMFLFPASVLWALLPVVAHQRLGLGATGYGLLLGALGVGAIAGALFLPWLRTRLTPTQLLLIASVLYAGVLTACVTVPSVGGVIAFLPFAGAAWVLVLSTINAMLQLFLPDWVQARGLASYTMVLFGTQAVAAVLWGLIAQHVSLFASFIAAAGLMLLTAIVAYFRPFIDVRDWGREPAVYWPKPEVAQELATRRLPVMVTATYVVAPEKQAEFLRAVSALRESRMRTGAMGWELYRDTREPDHFVEFFRVASWEEHLQQHGGRLTATDRMIEERVEALSSVPSQVRHFVLAAE